MPRRPRPQTAKMLLSRVRAFLPQALIFPVVEWVAAAVVPPAGSELWGWEQGGVGSSSCTSKEAKGRSLGG